MKPRLRSVSLLWRILFSTSISITVLFAAMGWILQEQFANIATASLQEEVRASFQAYESLWHSRADQLATVSLVLSRLPQVRDAFSTADRATIRDAAGEVWDRVSDPDTLFLVTNPEGTVIAGVGSNDTLTEAPFVRAAAKDFPKQARGFVQLQGHLYQIVVTPVYVAGGLINVLVAGVPVDASAGGRTERFHGRKRFCFSRKPARLGIHVGRPRSS